MRIRATRHQQEDGGDRGPGADGVAREPGRGRRRDQCEDRLAPLRPSGGVGPPGQQQASRHEEQQVRPELRRPPDATPLAGEEAPDDDQAGSGHHHAPDRHPLDAGAGQGIAGPHEAAGRHRRGGEDEGTDEPDAGDQVAQEHEEGEGPVEPQHVARRRAARRGQRLPTHAAPAVGQFAADAEGGQDGDAEQQGAQAAHPLAGRPEQQHAPTEFLHVQEGHRRRAEPRRRLEHGVVERAVGTRGEVEQCPDGHHRQEGSGDPGQDVAGLVPVGTADAAVQQPTRERCGDARQEQWRRIRSTVGQVGQSGERPERPRGQRPDRYPRNHRRRQGPPGGGAGSAGGEAHGGTRRARRTQAGGPVGRATTPVTRRARTPARPSPVGRSRPRGPGRAACCVPGRSAACRPARWRR